MDGECVVENNGKTNFYEKIGGRHRYLIETASKERIVAYVRKMEHELF